jgi:hypothetical protein
LLSDLEKMGVESSGFEDALDTLVSAVNRHAEHEESEVFPLLREHVDAESLQKMASALAAAEAVAPTHPHPRGPEGAVGNLVVGPFVAIADRVRDALHSIRR